MPMPKLERITEETLTPEHTERVRRAMLGVPRKNSMHRAILADCASVLTGNQAARKTVVRTWNAMVTPIGELIENSSVGTAMRDIKERGLDAHLKTLDEELRPKRRGRKLASPVGAAIGLGTCATCKALRGDPCRSPSGRTRLPHAGRRRVG